MLTSRHQSASMFRNGLFAWACACLLLAVAAVTPVSVLAATAAGTDITNVVTATFGKNGMTFAKTSSVSFTTEESPVDPTPPAPTPSEIALQHVTGSGTSGLSVAAAECGDGSGNYTTISSVTDILGNSLTLPGVLSTADTEYGFKIGEPLLVLLTDADQNLSATTIDQVVVTVSNSSNTDTEQLRLSETGIDTGVFAGVIDTVSSSTSTVSYNCALSLKAGMTATVSYEDSDDATDASAASAVFDPYSRVFNANTGEPINGIEITLIDASTGEAATVYDDDGVTPVSATVTTGPATSSSSAVSILSVADEVFPAGSFRFPYVPAGTYRLQFSAPAQYRVPSSADDSQLAELTGDFVVNGISRGESFTLNQHILLTDIPADDLEAGVLLSKTANKTEVGVGDFIQYTISLSNKESVVTNAQIVDQLPAGLRYRKGSARINDEKVADPAISGNGQTLTFSLPDLAADEDLSITYVTQVTALAQDTLINTARLVDDQISANTAQASVKVIDEFFKDRVRLFGRVYLDDCNGNLDAEAVSNVRLFMEDGTYVVTDANGEWHIENVRPGTHVVQLDTSTIPPYMEVMECDQRGFHAGRAFSQFVDVQGGSFWRVDFALKMKQPDTGEITQQLSNELIPMTLAAGAKRPYNSPVPEKLRYTLNLKGTGVEINNLLQMIALPEGVIYEPGSSVMDGEPWPDPQISYGTLIYKLGNKPKEWTHQLVFTAVISDKAKTGELTARAIARFQVGKNRSQLKPAASSAFLQLPPDDGQVKPINPPKFANFAAELTEEDKVNLRNVIERLQGLRNLKVEVIGHTDSTPIAKRNKHIFADNQALSEARAASVAAYLADQLGVAPQQILSAGKGSSQPVASNGSAVGRAQNRRVEVKVLNGEPDVQIATATSGIEQVAVQAAVEGFINSLPATAAGAVEDYNAPEMPVFDENWFNTAADEAQWLWPPVDRSPAIASTKIAISHAKDERIRLLLNDKPVSPLNFDGTESSNKRDRAVSIWRGVDLEPGPNRFSVYVINKDGDIVEEFERNVQFAQVPAKAVLVADKTRAVADGINPAIIAVRLTDKDGFPIRYNVTGDVDVAAPYELFDFNQQVEGNPLGSNQKIQYRVGNDGIALINLAPTTQAGEARLTFKHQNGQEDVVSAWLKPAKRDWILVGLGDFSVGYNSASGDSAGRRADGIDDNIYHDGRMAFFTQGQVTGDWLITAAYDSGKPEADAFASLIEPDRYYTLYGDASNQQLDASSARKLYVRLERERFFAVFGDINTGLNSSTLSQYNRKMTGAQTQYQGEMIEASGFVAQSDTGTVRDDIQGDGTSGLYRFSQKNIVLNSETITLEVRDRYRSEVIVSSETLTRDTDYVIDYDDGTVYFKSPISATDENFNPRYIVAEYEVEGGKLGYVSGGRVGVKLLKDSIKAGVTSITQNQSGEDQHLHGADLNVTLGDTRIKAEVAQSETVTAGVADGANAHLLEVTHRTQALEATAYIRSQDENFGFEQSPTSENDYRKEGAEASLYLSDKDALNLEGFHHYQLSTGYDSYQASTEWVRKLDGQNQVSLGLVSAQEESADDVLISDQVTAGYTTRVLNSRLALSVKGQSNVTARSEDDDLMALGAEYRLTDAISLYAEHETGFSSTAPERSTLGARATPWTGAQVQQSVEQVEQDDAYRLYAVSGLNQDISLTDAWSLSFGFDQAQNLDANNPGETSDTTEDYYAMYAGSAFRTPLWQWNNRLERREGDETDKWVARTSLYHPLTDALAMGGSVDYFTEDNSTGYSNELDTTFDLALRPRKHPVALLWQARWVQQAEGTDGELPERTRKLINNLHGNWLFTPANQLAAQYGIKRVLDQYDSDNYASTTDFMAAEWRHHLNDRWDIGAHGRRLHSYEAGQTEHGTGVSVGWIPQTNVWLGLGYNFTGFIDTDFSAANFTAKGVYLKMRFKADQETLATLRAAFR
ncbi:OmpA family protein [Thalassolituus sp. LLYu03]|uniref:OmpA family protein n=1 Tax=Thalassolituus sp. LLYu03 TaxID=3421656 RepID=UPI003D297CF5